MVDEPNEEPIENEPTKKEEELPKDFEDLSDGEEIPNEDDDDDEVEELEDLINPKE